MKKHFILLSLGIVSSFNSNFCKDKQESISPFSYVLYVWHASLSATCLVEGGIITKQIGTAWWNRKYKNISFPYAVNQITCGDLSETARHALASWTEDDFDDNIDQMLCQLSEEDEEKARYAIVTQYNLYQFPAFVATISTWPEFKENLKALHAYLLYNNTLKERLYHLQGFEDGEFFNFIKTRLNPSHFPCSVDL